MFGRLILIVMLFLALGIFLIMLPKIFLRGTEKVGELFEFVSKKFAAALVNSTRELVAFSWKIDAFIKENFQGTVQTLKSAGQFLAKKILIALPWTVAAFVALTVGLFALGRQFFCADNAKRFVEKFLPPKEFERKTLSLALIELMIILHEKILERVNHASRS